MKPTKVDVLIYSGRGVSPSSLSHTTACLRAILLPQYSVRDISTAALISEPWYSACALLVFPGGRDVPYHEDLESTCETIRQYVQDGGACLAFCAGAYFTSGRVEWEVGSSNQVVGDRSLGFFPGTCQGCVYSGFSYDDESGARAIALEIECADGTAHRTVEGIYYNGGGHFVDADDMKDQGVTPLARYFDDEGAGKVAAVACTIGKGKAVLWGAHPEYSLLLQPTIASLDKSSRHYSASQRVTMETERWNVMRETLRHLDLLLPPPEPLFPPEPSVLPQHLTSAPWKPHLVTEAVKSLSIPWPGPASATILEDVNDTFRFRLSSRFSFVSDADDGLTPLKNIVVHDNDLPPARETPLFNIRKYYDHLSKMTAQIWTRESESHKMGELLLYGERVTSTQTMLDKNPRMLSSLPSPLVSLASLQLNGRGRGPNAWVSPMGCLTFSLLLRPPPKFPAPSLVFIQYLFSLAVVQACRSFMGSAGDKIRLKWPNDIYAVTRNKEGAEVLSKLGGVLVNTSFSGGKVDVVIGLGLNVFNERPTTSLVQLLSQDSSEAITLERALAAILVRFNDMWDIFVAADWQPFNPFQQMYHNAWLHSNQVVTITSVTPPIQAKIVGICPYYGTLRAVPLGGREEEIRLQPDGNSFDMMAGLIKMK